MEIIRPKYYKWVFESILFDKKKKIELTGLCLYSGFI